MAASRCHLLASTAELYDYVSKGGEVTRSQRLTFRRDQVRASRRAVDAIDRLFKVTGASGIRNRLRRISATGATCRSGSATEHPRNVAENIYAGWATDDLGGESALTLFV